MLKLNVNVIVIFINTGIQNCSWLSCHLDLYFLDNKVRIKVSKKDDI